jgi:predicted transcriptional regulator
MTREKVSVRLDPEVARGLRRLAARRGLTLSAALEQALRERLEGESLELLLRACLEGLARLLAPEGAGPEGVRKAKLGLLDAAMREREEARARAAKGAGQAG